MTIDFFSLNHSRTIFNDPQLGTERRLSEIAEAHTSRLIVAAVFYDFGSENSEDWALATNIARWLQREEDASGFHSTDGKSSSKRASQHIAIR